VIALRTVVTAAMLVVAVVPSVYGQVYVGGDAPGKGSIEFGGGGMWSPGFETGSVAADLTRSGSDRLTLFNTEGEVNGFPGFHARIGVYLSRTISVEGGVRYAKPELSYRLTDDFESAPDETATEVLSHYVFDGSVLFHLGSFGDGRGIPFVSGGGGYVRELHEGNELVESGNEIHATAGLKYWFGARHFGLRVEAGVTSREKGFDKREGRRTLPLVLGGLTMLF
jgi:hypothetical protein